MFYTFKLVVVILPVLCQQLLILVECPLLSKIYAHALQLSHTLHCCQYLRTLGSQSKMEWLQCWSKIIISYIKLTVSVFCKSIKSGCISCNINSEINHTRVRTFWYNTQTLLIVHIRTICLNITKYTMYSVLRMECWSTYY